MMAANRRGMILILSSPSGAGKTTLTRMLMQDKTLDLTLSVSVTTRPRRSSEVDGIHYRFIDRREFDRMRKGGDLLESAEVHGNVYGTPREPVEKVLAQGRDMLFDIDWQGAGQMRERLGEDVVSDVRPAAVDARNCAPGSSGAPKDWPPSIARASTTPGARSSAGGLPVCHRQRRSAARLSRGGGDRRAPSGLRCTRVETGIERFVGGVDE